MERMVQIGNERAASLYGGLDQRPGKTASDSEWLHYLKEKYEHRKWATATETTIGRVESKDLLQSFGQEMKSRQWEEAPKKTGVDDCCSLLLTPSNETRNKKWPAKKETTLKASVSSNDDLLLFDPVPLREPTTHVDDNTNEFEWKDIWD